ncbi:MAG: NADP-dependent oxidoreductase [Phenylobacterium sp.]|nr:NADP-dependent oxidoreductase [Phenylobacterium sp.]
MKSREIRLVRRPDGLPGPADFAEAVVDVPAPRAGEVCVRNLFMAVDPAMRGRMSEAKSYVPPFVLDAAMEGPAIGEVIASAAEGFAPGDIVFSRLGWREAFTTTADKVTLRDCSRLPPEMWLHAAGTTGLTAYAGLHRIAQIRPGDVIFVSAAAGAVGSLACQMAKLKGHKVIGSAGGARKAAYLRDELGLDGVIDYKAEPSLTKALARELRAIGAEGLDVYFDNVGGDHLQAALATAKPHARFAICGMISQYNTAGRPDVPRNLTMLMVKSIRMEGYIAFDHLDLEPYMVADVTAWHMAGLLKSTLSISEGIDNALEAFLGLFRGDNLGRSLVRLGEPSPRAPLARSEPAASAI